VEFMNQWSFWVRGLVIFVVGLFGLAGNVLTIIVLRQKSQESNSNFKKLMIALAVADNLMIIDLMIESGISLFGNSDKPFVYKYLYPSIIHPAKGIIQALTIYMVVAVSAERYKAVCHPLSYRHGAYKFILLVVAVSIGLKTPRFFQFKLDYYHPENSSSKINVDYVTTDLNENPTYIQFSSYWDDIFSCGVLPLLLLVFFNLQMILKIRASNKFGNYRFVGGGSSRHGEHGRINSMRTTMTQLEGGHVAARRAMSMNGHRKTSQEHVKNATLIPLQESPVNGRSTWRLKRHLSILARPPGLRGSGEIADVLEEEEKAIGIQNLEGTERFQKRREKSTIILVMIVVIFLICNSYRLVVKLYLACNSQMIGIERYRQCHHQGRSHIPLMFYVFINMHPLFLVINSSINFIIYCCVGKDFRRDLKTIFCRRSASV